MGPLAKRVAIAIALVWAGISIGVALIAVPAQFDAVGLAREVGIDVTRHVFVALHRVEIGLALASLVALVVARPRPWPWLALAVVWLAVAIEGFWLLPVLEARAEMVLAGTTPPPAPWHRLYAGLEGAKLVALLAAAALLARAPSVDDGGGWR